MWKCPSCKRNFKSANQSHTCTTFDMGELFLGKPDALVASFDLLLQEVQDWEPMSMGAAKHSIVLTSIKAWLIVKPMKSELDLKFYNSKVLDSGRFKKVTQYNAKYAHHIRISDPMEVDRQLIDLLRIGFDYSLQ